MAGKFPCTSRHAGLERYQSRPAVKYSRSSLTSSATASSHAPARAVNGSCHWNRNQLPTSITASSISWTTSGSRSSSTSCRTRCLTRSASRRTAPTLPNDPAAAHRFWLALAQADRVFKLFRTGFLGKGSPVHFFWGSFDLAVTRFSGRTAPRHPGGVPGLPDAVTREAYSHEVSSAGFWPGNEAFPQAAFYSYAYPEPTGFRDRPVTPGAHFDKTLGEFILPYDTMRTAPEPDALLLDFCPRRMRPQRRLEAGTASRWNVRLGFRGRCAGSSSLRESSGARSLGDGRCNSR